MKTFRNIIMAICVSVAGMLPMAAHAGIPVIDAASLADDITNEVSNLAQYVQQYNALVQQYNQALAQYNSLNGIRSFQALFNDPVARQYLPANWAQTYQAATYAANCTQSDMGAKAACIATAKQSADNSMIAQMQVQIAQRRQNIQDLINQLGNAPDAKDTADLQARISGEVANLANEQADLEAYKQASAQQDQTNTQAALAGAVKIDPAVDASAFTFTQQ